MKTITLAVLTVLACGPFQARAWDKIEGASSGIHEKKMAAVACPKQWAELWRTHALDAKQKLPETDFSRDIVVAVFLGDRPSGGYGVELIFQPDPSDKTKIFVLYREKRPKAKTVQTQALTQPFQLVRLAKPAAGVAILFEEDQTVHAYNAQSSSKWIEALELLSPPSLPGSLWH